MSLTRISIDQQAAMKYGIPNANCHAVFDVLASSQQWANEWSEIDGALYYFTARQEISRRLPLFKIMPDTCIRHVKKLVELGLVLYQKIGKKDYTALTIRGQEFFQFTMSKIDSKIDSSQENRFEKHHFQQNSKIDSKIDSTYGDPQKNNNLQKNSKIDSTELYLSNNSNREMVSPEIEFEAPNNPEYKKYSAIYRKHNGVVKPRYDAKVFYLRVVQPNRVDEFALGLQNILNTKKTDGTALQSFENFIRDGAWEGHEEARPGSVQFINRQPDSPVEKPTSCQNSNCKTPDEISIEPNGFCIWCNRPDYDPATGEKREVVA